MRAHGEGGEMLDINQSHKIYTCEPCNLLFNLRLVDGSIDPFTSDTSSLSLSFSS